MKKGQKNVIIRILKYIKKQSLYIIISLISAVVMVMGTLYFPILTGNAIDQIIGPGKVDFTEIGIILKSMIFILVIVAIATWLMNISNNRLVYYTIRDIRKDAFAKLQRVPISRIDSEPHGDLVSRVVADVDQFADGLLMGISSFFTGVLTIVGTLIFMLKIDVRISLVVILLTPVSLFVASFISKRTYNMFKEQSATRGEQTSLINDMVGNEKLVQAYNYETRAIERFNEINDRLEKCSLKAIFFSSLTNPSTRFVNSLVYTGVGLVGALIALEKGITVGQLSCFLSYANQYTKPFNEISGVVTELQNALACAARIFELLDYEEIEVNDKSINIEETSGNIEFKDVSFAYVPGQKLIENLSVSIKSGETVAIVGPTGCGKTTLINLLMRFYDINSGEIKVDGINIEEITRESLRKNYGMVLQDTWIKSGTIKENILMAKPEATDEEVIEAAKKSFAHSFIKRLPQGYDTELSEGGGGLSGGQKQLLAITRALVSNPHMLILDEATSSIDTRTELKVQKAFDNMMKGRTSFIVAHRLSTIKNADIILVMKDGNIIEQGNHKVLLEKRGFYYELYNSQFSN
ncbi:MAG: ABC transporter ATP-binding protein [Lachnospiraceae bacterium]|nr:ABC transporter ATP-binding protein [Lachnospiraceae bacterium]